MRPPRPAQESPSRALALPRLQPKFEVPEDLVEDAERFLRAARAANTQTARTSDWQVFTTWCAAREREPLPAAVDTVFAFVTDLAAGRTMTARKPATLERYLATISVVHQGSGYPSPTRDARVRELMSGMRRTVGTKQRLAAPLTLDVLALMQPHCDPRDWALVCFGRATACRRSELCALNLSQVVIDARGAAVQLERSKTDQEAHGRVIAVRRTPDLCPVAALEAWLCQRGRLPGALFWSLHRNRTSHGTRLSPHDVGRIVKRLVAAAGFPADDYSAHSLRAGYVTDARRAGQTWAQIMEHTGHARLETVKGYARYERDPFEAVKE